MLYRDQGNMLSSTVWPVHRFTSDGGGGIFYRFYLEVFISVLTDTATINKYINNAQQLTFLTRNKSAEIKIYFNTP